MIILAAAIIISINNSGIVNRANEAVEKSNEAELKSLVTVAWSEAYFKVTEETKDDTYYLKEVKAYLLANGVIEEELNNYTLTATKVGASINKKAEGGNDTPAAGTWTQTGTTVTNDVAFYLGSDKISKDEDKAAYEMLIATIAEDGTETPLAYWLASPCADVGLDHASFGLRAVLVGVVNGSPFVFSDGDYDGAALGVRAVVSLDSNIQLEPASDTSWTITN